MIRSLRVVCRGVAGLQLTGAPSGVFPSSYRSSLHSRQSIALLRTSSVIKDDDKEAKKKGRLEQEKAEFNQRMKQDKPWLFHMSLTEDQKKSKKDKIEAAKAEVPPLGMMGKVKFYLKRYWYIAVPAHCASSTIWFGAMYALVSSGVNVPAMLTYLHMPEWIITKVQETPASASVIVVALILYKIASPLRYATTLLFIRAIFSTLKKMGKLPTAGEVSRIEKVVRILKG